MGQSMRREIKIGSRGNLIGGFMTRTQISGNQKDTRTQITDLPEVSVELSEREMRIVSGGLAPRVGGCGVVALAASAKMVSGGIGGSLGDKTQYNTNGDWDTDW
jgi:lactobin A/cerein 7B family class IIb bacteriocin